MAKSKMNSPVSTKKDGAGKQELKGALPADASAPRKEMKPHEEWANKVKGHNRKRVKFE